MSAFYPLQTFGGPADLSPAAIVFGIRKRPAVLRAPVACAIDHPSEVAGWAICGQLDDAHRDLVAYAAADDPRNRLVTDLEHAITELDLTTAFPRHRIAFQPSFN